MGVSVVVLVCLFIFNKHSVSTTHSSFVTLGLLCYTARVQSWLLHEVQAGPFLSTVWEGRETNSLQAKMGHLPSDNNISSI